MESEFGRILLVSGYATREIANRASDLLLSSRLRFDRVELGLSHSADVRYLESVRLGRYELLVNFLSPRYIPAWALSLFPSGGINFHPGTTKFPGVGSASLAIYHEEREFGAVAHYMSEKFDDGPIVWASTFPIPVGAGPKELNLTAHESCLHLFARLICWLETYQRAPEPDAQLRWLRPAVTRLEFTSFLELGFIPLTNDVERKIRATNYPGKLGAYVTVGTDRFFLPKDQP